VAGQSLDINGQPNSVSENLLSTETLPAWSERSEMGQNEERLRAEPQMQRLRGVGQQ